jgi:hypothetical protein
MPPKPCGCGFGHSAFGNSASSFFNSQPNPAKCLPYRNNFGPLTHSSGFGNANKKCMKIGSKKK